MTDAPQSDRPKLSTLYLDLSAALMVALAAMALAA
jgi:hypothetical protein